MSKMNKTPKFDSRTALRQIARANNCTANVKAGCITDQHGRDSYPTREFLKRAWDAYLAERNDR